MAWGRGVLVCMLLLAVSSASRSPKMDALIDAKCLTRPIIVKDCTEDNNGNLKCKGPTIVHFSKGCEILQVRK